MEKNKALSIKDSLLFCLFIPSFKGQAGKVLQHIRQFGPYGQQNHWQQHRSVSRYELIHCTLCKVLRQDGVIMMLNLKLRKAADAWTGEDSGKTVYRSNKEEMARKLILIGLYIYDVLKRLREDASGYDQLHRVFHDQYVVEKGKVWLKDKHKVPNERLQSPDNPDTAYRDKGDQKVSGILSTKKQFNNKSCQLFPGQCRSIHNNILNTFKFTRIY